MKFSPSFFSAEFRLCRPRQLTQVLAKTSFLVLHSAGGYENSGPQLHKGINSPSTIKKQVRDETNSSCRETADGVFTGSHKTGLEVHHGQGIHTVTHMHSHSHVQTCIHALSYSHTLRLTCSDACQRACSHTGPHSPGSGRSSPSPCSGQLRPWPLDFVP